MKKWVVLGKHRMDFIYMMFEIDMIIKSLKEIYIYFFVGVKCLNVLLIHNMRNP